MTVLHGFHHVAVLTDDLDRLLAFYRRVFDAPVVLSGTEDGRRHALIDVGGGGLLHAFEVPDGQMPPADNPRFQRGRLDHLAFHAPTQMAFLELRRRVTEVGATVGRVRDSGTTWSVTFRDPDGTECEVIWVDPDVPLSSHRPYTGRPL
jgi:catechol 2,3-dioxygenase-like lactoylglutathione lyase family enzyme